MKNYKLLTLALCFSASAAFALTADQYVTNGLASLAAQDIAGAYSNFNAAVTLSPTNEPANALLAVTRILVLPQQPAGSNFLNQLNVTNGSRNIYNWTAMQPVDTNGNTIWPANYNSSTAITFYRNTVVAALVASATNLANITDTNFTLSLLSTETGIGKFPGADVTLDYGDFQLLRALVAAGQFAGYTINAQNASVVIPTLQAMSEANGLTIQAVLAAYPSLLTLSSAADLTSSKGALTNAIEFYMAASDYIRNVRPTRPPGQGLFLLDDPKTIADEQAFRDSLTNVLLSLKGPVQFDPNTPVSLSLSNYFAGTKTLRSLLPQFYGDSYIHNTLPDYTFGGILLNEPAYLTEVILRNRFPSFAGIYTGQVYDYNSYDFNAGYFAAYVSTNQHVTVEGYDYDSAANYTNGQAGGISAQFNVDPFGNWSFQSNNVSGSGSLSPGGGLYGELDFTNGDSVQLYNSFQQSAFGPFQNAAGYYGGTWKQTSGPARSGTLQGILDANGDLFACVFQSDGIVNDGLGGQLDSFNNLNTSSADGTTVIGTLTNSTFTLGGNYVSSDGSGTFNLSRSARLDMPPVITVPPTNRTVGVGSNATFSVTATGSLPLYYQWYCNGVLLNLATNSSLVVSNVALSANGNDYMVAVRNVVGLTIGEADADAILNVGDTVKPVVTVTNLVANQMVSNGVFRASGTASDNSGVSAVWYQLNNGAWMLASTTNGWTNWWADLTLAPNTNTLRYYSVDTAAHGYVYVADTDNSLIRKITPNGLVTTLAGDTYDLTNFASNYGYADGTGSAAMFNYPSGTAVDGSGNIYVADTDNNLIRKITPAGVVTTLAGDTNYLSSGFADGTNGTALFTYPSSVAVDGSGNVYVADTDNNLIRKITPAGVVTTLAGNTNYLSSGFADGTNGTAIFSSPSSVTVDGSGNVYVADSGNNLIRKITPAGVVTTLAGDTNFQSSGFADGTSGTALFNYPSSVAVDGSGNVYVGDTYNNLIRKITPVGVVTTLAGDTYDLTNGFWNGGFADGTNGTALFDYPSGVAVDGSGNVYVGDTFNSLIRKITPVGVVTTLAGDIYDLTNNVYNDGYVDGTGGAAQFYYPIGVSLDNSGANISATTQISFDCVVSATLTVTTNGLGSLNQNYNGASLQISNTYSITATAGTGFVFTNWTGGTSLPLTLLTNGSTVRFVMVSNLMLQANFVDISKPTLSITNLTSGQRITNTAFTVKGTAGDNWLVSNVLCQVNGGGWNLATNLNNWTNWSAGVTLVPGTNLVQAYAVDTSGNLSVTSSVNCQFVVTNLLSLQKVGLGTFAPTNLQLEVGRNYSITATPATGFTFANWMGGTYLPLNFVTNTATLQFMMVSNLMLQATFVDTNKPVISITNLAAGQRITNTAFTVKGTAGDNWLVSNVLCQVNGGGWNSATNFNNWTNWSAGVTLVPGTNLVQAYAVDTSGNLSVTSSVNCQFVVTNLLVLQKIGLGTFSPTNLQLEVGRNYSITATPATGFAFTNWTGGTNLPLNFITNATTVQFMMVSNLTLQANFGDTNKPVISITNPAAGQRITNASFTVKGTAGDNWLVSNVLCQVNGGGWNLATNLNNWTNWSAGVTLIPGTNLVQAYAVDTSGNLSATSSVSCQFVVTNLLSLQKVGLGTFAPTNLQLEVGRNYSITAAGATGFVATNWVISTNWLGGVKTNNATVQFMMASNLTLQVTFAEVTKPTLTITAPAAGQHMTNALATVTGTASDNWKVTGVWYQVTNGMLTGGTWTLASTTNSYTNWTATLTLAAGTNMVKAYAMDPGGNYSITSSVSVLSSNTFQLQLKFAGPQPLTSTGFNFNLELSPGLNGHIQTSTNLADWTTLTNFVGTNSTLNFRDPAATNLNLRFYRAVVP